MVSTATLQPKIYVLQYDFVTDSLEKRKIHVEAHLALIDKQIKTGNIVLAGPLGHPPTGGLLIVRDLSPDNIEQLDQQDPFLINGIVEKYTIKPYMAVAGDALLNKDLIKIEHIYRNQRD